MSIDISSSLPSIQKVSVIVPCYNYGHFLGAALQSVQAQTLREWECIIVDDGSSDDTRAVAARYAALDTRIQYLFQTNSGHSAARNRGLEAAQGQYLQFLDADDLLQPHKLELQAAFLDSHPSVDIVYGNHRYFTEETAQEALIAPLGNAEQPKKPDQDCQIQTLLIERNIMVTHAPLFRRRVIEVIGLMDTSLEAAEDWDFWLRAALGGSTFHFQNWKASAALVRHHQASYSHNRIRMLEAIGRLRVKIERLTDDPSLLALSRRKQWEELAALGKQEAIYGRTGRGMHLLCQAGVSAHTPKWFLYALLLPLLRSARLRHLPLLRGIFRHME